jgi:hypothetical protein
MATPPPAELDTVRSEVRSLLGKSPAFARLTPDQRRVFAQDFVKVAGFLATPGWHEHPLPPDPVQARALADATNDLKERLSKDPGAVGKDFRAGAMREGTEQFGELVNKVDFPNFVGGLVQGVFQAVVNASIQQMEAYGELLSACAKTAEQFADDHITDGQARDWVANKHPSLVSVDTSGERAVLRPRPDAPEGQNVGQALRMKDDVDLSSDEGEAAVVAHAKLEMAKQRQQLMATMVMLGINRIVVTNGLIHAKVLFDVQTTDEAKRRSKAEMHDLQTSSHSAVAAAGGIGWGAAASSSASHRTTVASAVDDTSESKAQAKAQLSGEVKLSFKSETFPLEKMVDVMGMQTLNSRAGPLPLAPPPAPGRTP